MPAEFAALTKHEVLGVARLPGIVMAWMKRSQVAVPENMENCKQFANILWSHLSRVISASICLDLWVSSDSTANHPKLSAKLVASTSSFTGALKVKAGQIKHGNDQLSTYIHLNSVLKLHVSIHGLKLHRFISISLNPQISIVTASDLSIASKRPTSSGMPRTPLQCKHRRGWQWPWRYALGKHQCHGCLLFASWQSKQRDTSSARESSLQLTACD